MAVTIFLAKLWGPVMVSAGLGFFFSPKYYMRVYRDLEKSPFAVVFFGMTAIAAGVAHILVHNLWSTVSEIVVTLFGWSLLTKGFVCTAFPSFADQGADWVMNKKMMPMIGTAVLLLGLYLSWVGYMG
jgi:uncharacterized protein YjeT (DUF2065 family)